MDEDDLNNVTAELGRLLSAEQSVEASLDHVLRLTQRVLPAVDEIEIVLVESLTPSGGSAHSDGLARVQQEWRTALIQPVLHVASTGEVLRIGAIDQENRWPQFRRVASDLGFSSALLLPLVASATVGVLGAYSRVPDAFDETIEELGVMLSAQVAALIANVATFGKCLEQVEQLNQALESRTIIERARGVLMEREHCAADEAFEILKRVSQNEHIKLREVAQRMLGEMPSNKASK